MKATSTTVLLVDPDEESRARVAAELSSPQVTVLQVADAPAALAVLADVDVQVLMTELYLAVGEDQCLIYAVRRGQKNRGMRIIAHTAGGRPYDRDWAKRAGADAYLIKPVPAERLRYVVSKLSGKLGWGTAPKRTSPSALRPRGASTVRPKIQAAPSSF